MTVRTSAKDAGKPGVSLRTGPELSPIDRLTVAGFKSISEEQNIDIRPLTILAGANSSGKTSMMQPLLLLKQTLEAPYDPGGLLLDGPNVSFTRAEQLVSRTQSASPEPIMVFGLSLEGSRPIRTEFAVRSGEGMVPISTSYRNITLRLGMSSEEIEQALPEIGNIKNRIQESAAFPALSLAIISSNAT